MCTTSAPLPAPPVYLANAISSAPRFLQFLTAATASRSHSYSQERRTKMLASAVRHFSTKPKPKMKPIELKMPPEQTQTITRVIFDIIKEHGPLTVGDTWERVKEVGLRGLTGKQHMKIVLRWMRERQKLRLICNHEGPNKQFLYTTWFTKHNIKQAKQVNRLVPNNPPEASPSHPKI